ncbi:MAG: hypothetical protein WC823_06230 [Parcubacteria group bacterium]|jgi:hypothetical protein
MEQRIDTNTIETIPSGMSPISHEEEGSIEDFLAITQGDINDQFSSLEKRCTDYQGVDMEIILAEAKKLREEAMDKLGRIKNAN